MDTEMRCGGTALCACATLVTREPAFRPVAGLVVRASPAHILFKLFASANHWLSYPK